MYRPYFERLEDLRVKTTEILGDSGGLTIKEILGRLSEFRIPTTRHLVAVLARDPKQRFKCVDKVWRLTDSPKST